MWLLSQLQPEPGWKRADSQDREAYVASSRQQVQNAGTLQFASVGAIVPTLPVMMGSCTIYTTREGEWQRRGVMCPPVRLFSCNSSLPKLDQEPRCPYSAGRVPVRLFDDRYRERMAGKEPADAHDFGNEPVGISIVKQFPPCILLRVDGNIGESVFLHCI